MATDRAPEAEPVPLVAAVDRQGKTAEQYLAEAVAVRALLPVPARWTH